MNKLSRMRWAENIVRTREMRNAYKILAGKSEGERPLGKLRRRKDDNIRMDRDQWRSLLKSLIHLQNP
jgi:hypothetical protein